MPPIVKDLFLSKKFLVALFTAAGSVTAYLGWNVDPMTILTVATPFLIFIGAQGWADNGKEKAKVEQDTALKLQENHLRSTSMPPKMEVARTPEGGFTRVELMLVACVFSGAVLCGAFVSACSNPKQSTLRFGQCILDNGVLSEVLAALSRPDYGDQVKAVGLTRAPDLVNCALQAVASQPTSDDPKPEPGNAGVASLMSAQPEYVLPARAREVLESRKATGP